MLAAMLIVACGPGLVFALGSWAVFRPGGPGLSGPVMSDNDDDFEFGDFGS